MKEHDDIESKLSGRVPQLIGDVEYEQWERKQQLELYLPSPNFRIDLCGDLGSVDKTCDLFPNQTFYIGKALRDEEAL